MAKDKGYTKINNNIWYELAKLKLNGGEYAVLCLFISQTVCFHRHETSFSNAFICSGTGLSEKTARRSLSSLVDKKILKIKQFSVGTRPQIVQFYSGQFCPVNFVPEGGHFCPSRVDISDQSIMVNSDHQEIINKIKNKEIKKEERDFTVFLPKKLRNKAPEDMTDSEFAQWHEIREKFERGELENGDISV